MGLTNRGRYHFLNSAFMAAASPSGFYLALCTGASVPGASKNAITDMAEIASGNGYSTGGASVSRNSTDFDILNEDDSASIATITLKDVVFTATGGDIPASGSPIRYAVLLDANVTASSRNMLAWWDLNENIIISTTQVLTLQNPEIRLAEKSYQQTILDTFSTNIVGYWPLNDSGSVVTDVSGNGYSGSYSSSGVTKGVRGIGDGQNAVSFNGSGFGNIWSAGLSSAFGYPLENTFSVWFRLDNWDDWTNQSLGGRPFCLRTDAQNGILAQKLALNNKIMISLLASGSDHGVLGASQSSPCWLNMAMTTSYAASRVRGYINGASYFETSSPCPYTASGLSSFSAVIGSDDSRPNNTTGGWRGSVQHALFINRELSASEILFIYNQVG